MSLPTDPGDIVILAVGRSCALERAIVTEGGTVFVWSANAAEQIEAALDQFGWKLVPKDSPQ